MDVYHCLSGESSDRLEFRTQQGQQLATIALSIPMPFFILAKILRITRPENMTLFNEYTAKIFVTPSLCCVCSKRSA